jgi:hypothetical protein
VILFKVAYALSALAVSLFCGVGIGGFVASVLAMWNPGNARWRATALLARRLIDATARWIFTVMAVSAAAVGERGNALIAGAAAAVEWWFWWNDDNRGKRWRARVRERIREAGGRLVVEPVEA